MILSNVTEGIYPGQMAIISAGRRTGKSWYGPAASMTINNIKFMSVTDAIVDDEPWRTVLTNAEVAAWLRTQDKILVAEGQGGVGNHASIFDVHEKIYSIMVLKFQ